jgi:tetratricopeptide (TPR) repeat protein
VRHATHRVVSAELEAAGERLDDGDREGALALLAEASRRVEDPRQRERLDRARSRIEGAAEARFVLPAGESPEAVEERIDRYNEATRLANAGNLDEAIALFDEVLAGCAPEAMCTSFGETADQVRAIRERKRLIRRYNEAVDLLNDGKRKAALEILRELETNPDPEVQANARKLLDRIGAR